MTLVVLTPLLAATCLALGSAFYVLKRKSLTQAICVQQASLVQKELKDTLEKLLRLNPQAEALRAQRDAADKALKAALSSVNPYAIAAAQAYWSAVVLQQTALRARQHALLTRAEEQRRFGHRQLRERLRELKVSSVEARRFYWRGLAVEAKPFASLTPNYEPLPGFANFQQQRFSFSTNLTPPFANHLPGTELHQPTECSVTLEEKEHKWKLRILAASALSKWSLF